MRALIALSQMIQTVFHRHVKGNSVLPKIWTSKNQPHTTTCIQLAASSCVTVVSIIFQLVKKRLKIHFLGVNKIFLHCFWFSGLRKMSKKDSNDKIHFLGVNKIFLHCFLFSCLGPYSFFGSWCLVFHSQDSGLHAPHTTSTCFPHPRTCSVATSSVGGGGRSNRFTCVVHT